MKTESSEVSIFMFAVEFLYGGAPSAIELGHPFDNSRGFEIFYPISEISDKGFAVIRGKKFRYQFVYSSQNSFWPNLLANLFCTPGNSERNIWEKSENLNL